MTPGRMPPQGPTELDTLPENDVVLLGHPWNVSVDTGPAAAEKVPWLEKVVVVACAVAAIGNKAAVAINRLKRIRNTPVSSGLTRVVNYQFT